MDSKCGICLEPYTKKTRAKLTCQYCPVGACRLCQQNYLLSTYQDPHCFTCKQGWSSDFMTANFPVIFRTKTLRLHRRNILLEREKSLLPAMQIFVEAKKMMRNLGDEYDENSKKMEERRKILATMRAANDTLKIAGYDLYNQSKDMTIDAKKRKELRQEYKKKLNEWKINFHAAEQYNATNLVPIYKAQGAIYDSLWRWRRTYDTGEVDDTQGRGKKERREFVMRCPGENCRGFLSTAYKCGVCEKKTCSDCLEVLGDSEHTCKPDAVESAKTIKKETRPCPKCGVRIYKIDGCDQMWCTVEGCSTAFSWETGEIVTGRVHNPHYYEWLRRAGGGTAPREVGDIPCGGVPEFYHFYRRVTKNTYISEVTKEKLYEIHRNVLEFETRLHEYPTQVPALYNKEINVDYLMNAFTEEDWMRRLEHAEAKFNRKKEIGQILQTLVIASADVLREIANRLNDKEDVTVGSWLETRAVGDLEGLRTYTNECFQKLSLSVRQAVPQIKEDWKWMPIRALYKPKKNEIIGEGESVPVADVFEPAVEPVV